MDKTKPTKRARLKKAVFALPSLVTLGSVFCAFLSMAWSFQAQALSGDARLDMLFNAALAIIGSIIFDTFDGKVARATHTSTKFGMELDSLADATSFGIAPAILMYGFALSGAGWFGIIASFLFAAGSILRLARFNVEAPPEGVQTFFKGMPAPGGAACITAIVMAAIKNGFTEFSPFEVKTFGFLAILIGILMISTVKYKTFKGKKTIADYIYVAFGILGVFIPVWVLRDPATAFFCLVCYYVAYGILYTMVYNLRHMKPHRRRRKDSMSITDMPAATESNSEEAKSEESKSEEAKSEEAKSEDKAS